MSSWRPAQSEVVGGGKAHSGSRYRALVALCCAWCGATVAIGEEFTRSSRGLRRSDVWRGGLRHIVCARCSAGQGPPGTQEAGHGG